MAAKLSTLCYIEKEGRYLMLHRTVKKNDVNHDKWIGVGGHFEYGESPEECLLREVKEETGYTLTSWRYRGIVTFVYGEAVVEYMSLDSRGIRSIVMRESWSGSISRQSRRWSSGKGTGSSSGFWTREGSSSP